LFAVASLRVSAAAIGVEEITTFHEQVRIRPVPLDDALLSDLTERVYGATYHEAKQTLNLVPERVFGMDMVRHVERWLLEAVGTEPGPALRSVP
jgi:hypothetical protein